MRFPPRLSALAAVAIAGLALTITGTASAAPARHEAAPARHEAAPARNGASAGTVSRAVAVSPSGSTVFVTGAAEKTTPKPHPTGLTLAYDATTGAVLWRAAYHPVKVRFSSFSGIAVSPDGSMVFATGEVQRLHETQPRFLTVAYNATTGAKIWSDTEDVFGTASAIAVSPDGSTVFVTGKPAAGNPTTVAYKAANGSPLWTQSAGISTGASIAVSPDGSAVFATGAGLTAGSSATVAYNPANGVVLWATPAAETPAAIAVSPDGSSVFVTGTGPSGSGTQEYAAHSGVAIWQATGLKTGASIAVATDGSAVFVTGAALGSTDPSTIAYSPAGTTLWGAEGPGQAETGVSVAVQPGGPNLFVTGTGAAGASTGAYNASSGTALWSVAGNGLTPHDLAVSPDGSKVFVTGTLNNGTAFDTVAYSDAGAGLWQRTTTTVR